jgi:hypothetical protein
LGFHTAVGCSTFPGRRIGILVALHREQMTETSRLHVEADTLTEANTSLDWPHHARAQPTETANDRIAGKDLSPGVQCWVSYGRMESGC